MARQPLPRPRLGVRPRLRWPRRRRPLWPRRRRPLLRPSPWPSGRSSRRRRSTSRPPAPAAGAGAETQPILRAQTGSGPQAQLNIESGPDAGNNHQAGDAALRVGRSPDNDLILRDPATSGHHARVERRGQQFWIVDLGSTNGTLVNGEPIQEKELSHGDRITIGQNAVSFAIVEA